MYQGYTGKIERVLVLLAFVALAGRTHAHTQVVAPNGQQMAPNELSPWAETSSRRERVVTRPQLPWTWVDEVFRADRVILKFDEGTRVRLVNGGLQSLDGREHDLAAVVDILGDTTQVNRLFTRPVDDLRVERERLQQNVPPDSPLLADLNNYYRLTTSGVEETTRLVNELNPLPLVEVAYAEPIPVLFADDIPPATPKYEESCQTYLGLAPAGYEYLAIRSVVGARFPDNQMAQLEFDWYTDHEDLSFLNMTRLGLPPVYTATAVLRRHGTATVGIMAAENNHYGVTGMGSATRNFFVSSIEFEGANTISLATEVLDVGDVMSSSYGFLLSPPPPPFVDIVRSPLDHPQAEFDACTIAAEKGIVYAISAGNSNDDLGDYAKFGARYLPQSPSSGAFIIGATDGSATVRWSNSNYGARIDTNGWGQDVATVSGPSELFPFGALPSGDVNQAYTAIFFGTSSAAPSAAGVIAALIGAVKEQNSVTPTLDEIRLLIKTTGTTITPASEPIGNRPNLLELFAAHGLPDGLLVTQQGTVGRPFTYEVSGNPGDSYEVLWSPDRGKQDFGYNRDILIDLASATSLSVGFIPPSGTLALTDNVPNDPTLLGQSFYLQAKVILLPSGVVHITNSAELWIHAIPIPGTCP